MQPICYPFSGLQNAHSELVCTQQGAAGGEPEKSMKTQLFGKLVNRKLGLCFSGFFSFQVPGANQVNPWIFIAVSLKTQLECWVNDSLCYKAQLPLSKFPEALSTVEHSVLLEIVPRKQFPGSPLFSLAVPIVPLLAHTPLNVELLLAWSFSTFLFLSLPRWDHTYSNGFKCSVVHGRSPTSFLKLHLSSGLQAHIATNAQHPHLDVSKASQTQCVWKLCPFPSPTSLYHHTK